MLGKAPDAAGRAAALAGALAILALLLAPAPLLAAESAHAHATSEALFLTEILLLLVSGRLLGEAMQRIGQPAVMGQLIAGILLGPSVFGALLPDLQQTIFPSSGAQKSMIDAVSQLGILMLLLLTGMETDLSVVRKARRAAFSVSLTGIAVPFACGFALGEFLPDSMLPDPERRIITSLFLGTALAISSVKIVAMVVREVGFVRRLVGQVIIASAIVDDTIGWIIMAVTFGLAQHGQVDLAAIGQTVIGTVVFLAVSFTLGRRLVFLMIRWANDTLVSEAAVITTILVIMGLLALTTQAIGVHTVLGAFVSGILIGQSPILTRQIDERLRGLIVALFMPVFFGMAGLSADLRVLADPSMLLLSLGMVAIASLGKFAGAFIGGEIGGMTRRESLALACGMNARGSTEVIVATLGLSMGVLSQPLFTMIVAMAVLTTMVMPPMLRWTLARVPLRPDEQERLEREAFEARGFVSNIERLLVAVDASCSGQLASRLVGLLAGLRRIPTTVLHFDYAGALSLPGAETQAERTKTVIEKGAESADAAVPEETHPDPVEITTRVEEPTEEAISAEAKKGYDLLVIGREPASEGADFHEQITRSATGFDGAFAIAIARGEHRDAEEPRPLNILVPVNGTSQSMQAAELAVALARATLGSVTALHVVSGAPRSWGRRMHGTVAQDGSADAMIRSVVQLAERYKVTVRGSVRHAASAEDTILRAARDGRHNLIVMGVSPRRGDQLFFGPVPAELVARAGCSLLLVSTEAPTAMSEPTSPELEQAPPMRAAS